MKILTVGVVLLVVILIVLCIMYYYKYTQWQIECYIAQSELNRIQKRIQQLETYLTTEQIMESVSVKV